jgi:predicted metalloprotease
MLMADWNKILSRGNVEDRRSAGPLAIGSFGGLGAIATLLVLVLGFLNNPDPGAVTDILSQLQQTQVTQQNIDTSQFEGQDSYETFASAVLGSNNDMWRQIFTQNGMTYTEPALILFRNATQSGCGIATSKVGPHYCPSDESIYLDETFFDELQSRFGADGGDVAEAYVIAHEVGHHAQNKLGIMQRAQGGNSQQEANDLSVKLELQADCFAGLWAHSIAQLGVFEQGEIAEAIDAAAAVGDDRIQEAVTGQINPETWTHGSSEQRVAWFNTGYESGQPSSCDTF